MLLIVIRIILYRILFIRCCYKLVRRQFEGFVVRVVNYRFCSAGTLAHTPSIFEIFEPEEYN